MQGRFVTSLPQYRLHQFPLIPCSRLGEHAGKLCAHGADGDTEVFRDLFRCPVVQQQFDDPLFRRGDVVRGGELVDAISGWPLLGVVQHQHGHRPGGGVVREDRAEVSALAQRGGGDAVRRPGSLSAD